MQVHKKEKLERHISLMESERTGILWQSVKVGQKCYLLLFFSISLYTTKNSRMDFSRKPNIDEYFLMRMIRGYQIGRSLDHLSKV